MRYLASVAVLLSIVLCAPTRVVSEDTKLEAPKFSARVQVDLQCGDEIMRSDMSSYINRELRSLGDVTVVDTEPQWTLHIIAYEMKTKGGQPTGVAVSLVVTSSGKQFAEDVADVLKRAGAAETTIKLVTEDISSMVRYGDHLLQTGLRSGLKGICESNVSTFDSRTLEPARKFSQRRQDILQQFEKYQKESKPSTPP